MFVKGLIWPPNVQQMDVQNYLPIPMHIERLKRNKDTKTPKLAAKAINKNASEWTVRRALRRIGLVSAVKQKKPALSNKNVKARLQFCKEYGSWTGQTRLKLIASSQMEKNIIGIVHMKIFNSIKLNKQSSMVVVV